MVDDSWIVPQGHPVYSSRVQPGVRKKPNYGAPQGRNVKMNAKNKLLMSLIILMLSGVAFLVMYYTIGWSWKKSLIISGGAGLAMIVFDVLLRNRKVAE